MNICLQVRNDIAATPSFSLVNRQYDLEGSTSDIESKVLNLVFSWRGKLFRHFNFQLENAFRQIFSRSTLEQENTTTLDWRIKLDASYRSGPWKLGAVLERTYSRISTGGHSEMLGSKIRVSKKLKVWKSKEATLTILLFNPLNIKTYGRVGVYDYLATQDLVEAVAPYGLVTLDIPL